MIISEDTLFQLKQQLETESQAFSQQLSEIVAKQPKINKIQALAESILTYEKLQREISDRGILFAFFSSPEATITSPYKKAELFEYIEAAETVGPQLVDVMAEYFLDHVRLDIQTGEDDAVDLIQAEFKEYIIPAKIIAERFEQIDGLLEEMNRYCHAQDPQYDNRTAEKVLVYAFEASMNADIRLEPTAKALREFQFQYLTPEDRAALLDRVEERLAIIRFEEAKNQNIAMEKAMAMIEQRENAKA